MSRLVARPVPTRIFTVGESLADFIVEHIPQESIGEKAIIAITSKIVSLAENRVVARASIEKSALVQNEADHNLGLVAFNCYLTVKHGIVIPSAGIDESNSQSGG